ncbi:hypothetical protein AB6A40_009951 [Gnathostoma spinigerum]|uniref:Chromo domain-containing protein n=1 Tax=Gnathostoma spinigerum TaxID=75299 RepID=A0ABD6F1S9_9BILA
MPKKYSTNQEGSAFATLEEYIVEKIVNKRERDGQTEYCVKWRGLPSSENTWEPEQNLNCPDLLAEYELAEKRSAYLSSKDKTSNSAGGSECEADLEPECILGESEGLGEPMMWVKWKDRDEFGFLPASLIKARFPEIVFDFYCERLQWKNEDHS